MRTFVRRLLGKKADESTASASHSSSTTTTMVPLLKPLRTSIDVAETNVEDVEGTDASGYVSPGLLDVAAVSGLSSPVYSFGSRNTTTANFNNPNTSNPAGVAYRDFHSAAANNAVAEQEGEDDDVDGFLQDVIAGKTDVLRKQLAKQKLEAAAAAAAAALAVQNAHNHSGDAAGVSSTMDGQRAGPQSRQGSTLTSLTAKNNSCNDIGMQGSNNNVSETPIASFPTDGKKLTSPQLQGSSQAVASVALSSSRSAPQTQPQHRHKYVSSAARSLQDYELIAFLGSGTFAEVTLARRKVTDDYFAVKKISKQRVKEEGCVERTFTERQLLANLQHPFLVRLHQAFQSQTHLYLVLDFAQGGDLFYLNKQQLWLRSMKRTLVKMQYPYYQSTSATFSVLSASGSGQRTISQASASATPPPALSNMTYGHGTHVHQEQHHHHTESSSIAPLVHHHHTHNNDKTLPSQLAAITTASVQSSESKHEKQSPDFLSSQQFSTNLVRPPLPSTSAAAPVPVNEDSNTQAEDDANHNDDAAAVASSTTATATLSVSSAFTTTCAMSDTTVTSNVTNCAPASPPDYPTTTVNNSENTNTCFSNTNNNNNHNNMSGTGHPPRSHVSTYEDESKRDLTDLNNTVIGPSNSSRLQTSAAGSRRRVPDYRYYTTDVGDEFSSVHAVQHAVSPLGNEALNTTNNNNGDFHCIEQMPSTSGAATTSPANPNTLNNKSSSSNFNNGGEDASSASPQAISTAAPPLLRRRTTPAVTPNAKVRYCLRRADPSTGVSIGDSSLSEGDADNTNRINAGDRLDHSASEGAGRRCSSQNSDNDTASTAFSTAYQCRARGSSAAAARAPASSTSTILSASKTSNAEVGNILFSPLAVAQADATTVAGTPNVSVLVSPLVSPTPAAASTGEDSGAHRDGEAAFAPPPSKSSSMQRQQSQQSQEASLGTAALTGGASAASSTDTNTNLVSTTVGPKKASADEKRDRKRGKKSKKKLSKVTLPEVFCADSGTQDLSTTAVGTAVVEGSGGKHAKKKRLKASTPSAGASEVIATEAETDTDTLDAGAAGYHQCKRDSSSGKRAKRSKITSTLLSQCSLLNNNGNDTNNTNDNSHDDTFRITLPAPGAAAAEASGRNNRSNTSKVSESPVVTSTATRIHSDVLASPRGVSPTQTAVAAHVDLAAPFHQVDMETSTTILRDLTPLRFAPDDTHRFPLRLIAFYAVEVALVLQYLHGEGFLYRDLKPENILLRGDGHVMLTDFGVAKYRKGAAIATASGLIHNNSSNSLSASKGTEATAANSPVATMDNKANSFTGTTQYMSPEMLRGLPHDSRTDWWSYGCLLFEWANGRKAFDGSNQFSLFRAIVEEDVKVTAEDYRLTPLEVHTRVAQLHYRSEELRLAYEECAAKKQRGSGPSPMTAAVIYNRGSNSFDVCLLSPPEGHNGQNNDNTADPKCGMIKKEPPASPSQVALLQQQQHGTESATSVHTKEDAVSGLLNFFVPPPPPATIATTTSSPTPAGAYPPTNLLSPSTRLIPTLQCVRNCNSTTGFATMQQQHSRLVNHSFSGSGDRGNNNNNTNTSSAAAVAALLNDSFASQPGLPITPGAGCVVGNGLNDDSARLPQNVHLGDSFNNASFASIAHNSVFSLGGTPTNLSLQLTTTEDGNVAALVSSASPTALREQQRRERQRQSRRRRARLSCLAIDAVTRDRYLEDAVQQMEEAQTLLKDLTLKLLDRKMESRLSGAAVLEHPFFTCPYIVSQLYYRVHQQRSLVRELKRSAASPYTMTLGVGKSAGLSTRFGSCSSFTDLASPMPEDGVSCGNGGSGGGIPCFPTLAPGSSFTPASFASVGRRRGGLDNQLSSYICLPTQKRPDDWRHLFLERRIRALYVPRLRTRDDLRYFPSAVTATGLSAAVEQHRRIKEVKEQQKEMLRASKATMLNSNNSNQSQVGNNSNRLSGNSNITGTLSAAYSQLGVSLQNVGDPVVVVPMDAEAAHRMQQLLASGTRSSQSREHSRVASHDHRINEEENDNSNSHTNNNTEEESEDTQIKSATSTAVGNGSFTPGVDIVDHTLETRKGAASLSASHNHGNRTVAPPPAAEACVSPTSATLTTEAAPHPLSAVSGIAHVIMEPAFVAAADAVYGQTTSLLDVNKKDINSIAAPASASAVRAVTHPTSVLAPNAGLDAIFTTNDNSLSVQSRDPTAAQPLSMRIAAAKEEIEEGKASRGDVVRLVNTTHPFSNSNDNSTAANSTAGPDALSDANPNDAHNASNHVSGIMSSPAAAGAGADWSTLTTVTNEGISAACTLVGTSNMSRLESSLTKVRQNSTSSFAGSPTSAPKAATGSPGVEGGSLTSASQLIDRAATLPQSFVDAALAAAATAQKKQQQQQQQQRQHHTQALTPVNSTSSMMLLYGDEEKSRSTFTASPLPLNLRHTSKVTLDSRQGSAVSITEAETTGTPATTSRLVGVRNSRSASSNSGVGLAGKASAFADALPEDAVATAGVADGGEAGMNSKDNAERTADFSVSPTSSLGKNDNDDKSRTLPGEGAGGVAGAGTNVDQSAEDDYELPIGSGGGYYEQDAMAEEPHVGKLIEGGEEEEDERTTVNTSLARTDSVLQRTMGDPLLMSSDTSFEERRHDGANPLLPGGYTSDVASSSQPSRWGLLQPTSHHLNNSNSSSVSNNSSSREGNHLQELSSVMSVSALPNSITGGAALAAAATAERRDASQGGASAADRENTAPCGGVRHEPGSNIVAPDATELNPSTSAIAKLPPLPPTQPQPQMSSSPPSESNVPQPNSSSSPLSRESPPERNGVVGSVKTSLYDNNSLCTTTPAATSAANRVRPLKRPYTAAVPTSLDSSGSFNTEKLGRPISSPAASSFQTTRCVSPIPQQQNIHRQQRFLSSIATSIDAPLPAATAAATPTASTNASGASFSTAASNASPTPFAITIDTTTTMTPGVVGSAAWNRVKNSTEDLTTTGVIANGAALELSPSPEDALAKTRVSHIEHTNEVDVENAHNNNDNSTVVLNNDDNHNAVHNEEGDERVAPGTATVTRNEMQSADVVAAAAPVADVAASKINDTTTAEEDNEDSEADERSDETSGGGNGNHSSSDDDGESITTTTTASITSGNEASTSGTASTTSPNDTSSEDSSDDEEREEQVSSDKSKATRDKTNNTTNNGAGVFASNSQCAQATPTPQLGVLYDHESELASSTSSSSLLGSANSTISATTSSSSHSLLQLSTQSSLDHHQHVGCDYSSHRSPGHERECSVSGGTLHLLSTPNGNGVEGELQSRVLYGNDEADTHSPVGMMPAQVASVAGVNISSATLPSGWYLRRCANTSSTGSGTNDWSYSPGNNNNNSTSASFLANASGRTTAGGTLLASETASPTSGSSWPTHDGVGETRYFGDTLNPEMVSRPEFFGPLTTLSGVAYNLDEETSGGSVVGTPLGEPGNSPLVMPPAQQAPTSNTLGNNKRGGGAGSGHGYPFSATSVAGSSTSSGGLPSAGRDAKTLWAQQQRKRINRELQQQQRQGQSSPPYPQQQQQASPFASSNRGRQPSGGFGVSITGIGGGAGSFGRTKSTAHDEFFGFTFNSGSAGAFMQRDRQGSGESFDPFHSNNDVNNNRNMDEGVAMGPGGFDDSGAENRNGLVPWRHSALTSTNAQTSAPPPQYPPASTGHTNTAVAAAAGGLYGRQHQNNNVGVGGNSLENLNGSEEDNEGQQVLQPYSSWSNLSNSGDGSRSGLGDNNNFGFGVGGSGLDHFQNFSFTSPQILQQYLASRNADGSGGGGGGNGRPPNRQRRHR